MLPSMRGLCMSLISILVLVWIMMAIEPGLALSSELVPTQKDIALHSKLSFQVELQPGLTIKSTGPLNRTQTLLTESFYQETILLEGEEIGRIEITSRNLTNGDVIFFIESQGSVPQGYRYSCLLTLDSALPHEANTITYPYGKPFGGNSYWSKLYPLKSLYTWPSELVFLDNQDCSLVLGPVNQFQDLGRGVIKETAVIPITSREADGKSEFRYTLSAPTPDPIRLWGIVSRYPLVNWDSGTDVSRIQIADLNQTRKFWKEGSYEPVPSSYLPTDPRGFWLCPAQHVGKLFANTKSRFAYAIAINSMYGAISTQNDEGIWPTSPRSDWLYQLYGFEGGFLDTRFNTDAARFLLECYHAFGEKKALKAARTYADFLCSFADSAAYRTEGGLLVPDYRDFLGNSRTHTSLNHQLAEMNFLYEIYLTTGNDKFLAMAEKMRVGVKDTSDRWVKPTGELHYSRLPNGFYLSGDYPTLTLNELRQSKQLISQASGGQEDIDLARLITLKEEYNRKSGLPLW